MLFSFQNTFLFSLIWSVGCTTDNDGRVKFDAYLRDILTGKQEKHPIPGEVGKIEVPLPPEGLVYDYLFEVSIVLFALFRLRCLCICVMSTFIWDCDLGLKYAVKAQTLLAPLSWFPGSRIPTAHVHQCCRFQSYAKSQRLHAIAN